jgi:hypothetical protein
MTAIVGAIVGLVVVLPYAVREWRINAELDRRHIGDAR